MSLSRRYRDQPVEAVSRTPRSTAYACFTEEGYTVARDAFHSKFLSLTSEVGPWAPDSLTSLYNYLIAAIKLFNYGEAEEQCRYILGLMETLNMGQENCFICLECILDTSYFLSGKLDDAEHLFIDISQRGDLSNAHIKGQFDVLSLVRLTTKDCLVFWESPVKLSSILIPVTDYVDQLEGKRPKKGLIRSGIGSLRRIASLKWPHSSASSSCGGTDDTELRILRVQKALYQVTATSLFDVGFEKRYTKSKLSMLDPLESISTAAVSVVNGKDVVGAEIRSDAGEFGDGIEAEKVVDLEKDGQDNFVVEPLQYRVVSWLNDQKQHPPMPDKPPDDVPNGLTYRSMETTTSSLHGQKPQNQLEITLWAGDVPRPQGQELTLSALLDGGAEKTCMSEDCAQILRAPIREEEVHMTTANGRDLEVLGSVRIGFIWKGPSGSKVKARLKCYVVKDLQVAILFCANHITKLKLRDSSSLLAPILLGARSKRTKQHDAQTSKEIAEHAKANEQRESEQRKAERTKLELQPALNNNDNSNNNNSNQKPRATMDSLLGGSDTSVSSQRSSLTGFHRSITTSHSDESTRSGTSMESPRPKTNREDTSHRRSGAQLADSFKLRKK